MISHSNRNVFSNAFYIIVEFTRCGEGENSHTGIVVGTWNLGLLWSTSKIWANPTNTPLVMCSSLNITKFFLETKMKILNFNTLHIVTKGKLYNFV